MKTLTRVDERRISTQSVSVPLPPITIMSDRPADESAKPQLALLIAGMIAVQVFFGLYGIILKSFAQAANVNPLVFSLLRDTLCTPLLMAAAHFYEGLIYPTQWQEWTLFAFLGLFGMMGNQSLYIMGVYLSNAAIASIFQPLIPLLTAAGCALVFRELPSISKGLGIIGGLVGAFLMIFSRDMFSDASNSYLGAYAALLGNTTCMAIYMIIQRKFIFLEPGRQASYDFSAWREKPICITAFSYLLGAILMALASTYYVVAQDWELFELSWSAIPPLTYAVVISSALCYSLLSWGNKHLGSTTATLFWPLQVFVALGSTYLLFDKSLTAQQWIGGSIIIVSMMGVTLADLVKARRENSDDHEVAHVQGGVEYAPQIDEDHVE
eukprot:TRINITY_DN7113_c4_g1_i1.p1 TRINITY_DN7113_c4_g1~~TRINITY_DN7113_c4_g1_i1.p1  ORF type:complete len:382 (+),score=71.56 TRINITY_DN7113_c4_g1_i1:292-1437(+)